MNYYFQDSKDNAAAHMLALMSPDMQQMVADLILSKGRGVLNHINANDNGGLRPLAIFSPRYIPPRELPMIMLGISTIWIASLKKLKMDNDFYKKTLMSAFTLPDAMAESLAKSIETQDIIGGLGKVDGFKDWAARAYANVAERIRRIVNWAPDVLKLGLENDQAQDWDTDFLYEAKLLGETVSKLNSRLSLIGAQTKMNAEYGLFAGGREVYGDIEDLAMGDPITASEMQLAGEIASAGQILPEEVYGPYGGLVSSGLKRLSTLFKRLLSKKKETDESGGSLGARAAGVQAATRLATQNASPLALLVLSDLSPAEIKRVSELASSAASTAGSGDIAAIEGDIADAYGDPVAIAWRAGDIPGALSEIIKLAGDPIDSTGDPDFDLEIAGDVAEDGQWGALEGSLDPEIGGLFKRARLKRKLRKAARAERKAMKFAAKQQKKNDWAAAMAAADARIGAANQGYSQFSSPQELYAQMVQQYSPESIAQQAGPDMGFQPMPAPGADIYGLGAFQTPSPTINDDAMNMIAGASFGSDAYMI